MRCCASLGLAQGRFQCFGAIRLALAHTRGLHDKVTLALGALRTQAGAHPAQRAEHDASALEAIR